MRQLYYYLLIFTLSCGHVNGMLSVDANALVQACDENGKLETVKFLVEHGANVNPVGGEQFTPLFCAVGWLHMDIVEYLLSKGAGPNFKGGAHEVPLDNVWCPSEKLDNISLSMENVALSLRRLLLIHNADINRVRITKLYDSKRLTIEKTILSPFIRAIILNEQERISEFLKELRLEEVNEKHENGLTLLHWAAGRANKPLVKELFERGAMLAKDEWGHTPLTLVERIANWERKLLANSEKNN